MQSTCTNYVGGFNCSAYIIAGSFQTTDALQSLDPIVFASLDPHLVFVNLSVVGQSWSALSLSAGPTFDPLRFSCQNPSVVDGTNLAVCHHRTFS